MSERGEQPERPGWGLDFRVPGERREYRFSPGEREEFPRLGEPEKPKARQAGRINGAWGWALLLVPVLLFGSFFFLPETDASGEENSSLGWEASIIFLAIWFGPYLAGSAAVFRGSRRGVTWSFPVTCLFTLLILCFPLGQPSGSWIAGSYGFGVAGILLHVMALLWTRFRRDEGDERMSFA